MWFSNNEFIWLTSDNKPLQKADDQVNVCVAISKIAHKWLDESSQKVILGCLSTTDGVKMAAIANQTQKLLTFLAL